MRWERLETKCKSFCILNESIKWTFRQSYVLNFTEVELKVREATNEDPWGPVGAEMQEIAQLTFQYDAFSEVMGTLWKRMLTENRIAWRRVYKSLILLHHLIKCGSERVISNAKDRLFEMRALESYTCTDERGKDQGINSKLNHSVRVYSIQFDIASNKLLNFCKTTRL
jgi:telomere length regulation protein